MSDANIHPCMLPPYVTYNTYMRPFQHKTLNNVLFLNKKQHTFGKKPPPLSSFCNTRKHLLTYLMNVIELNNSGQT